MLETKAPPGVISRITLGVFRPERLTHPLDILERSKYSAHSLEVPGSGLELARRVSGGGSDFVCGQFIQQVVLPIQYADMGSEKFVR